MTKWADLQRLHDANKGRHILDLFDESRAGDFSIRADGMLFDYSKTNIDTATRAALVKLAKTAIEGVRDSGEPMALANMTAFERKVVHDEVTAAGLHSESEGVEPHRHIVISPA